MSQRDCFGDDDSEQDLSVCFTAHKNKIEVDEQVSVEMTNEVDVIQVRKEALKIQPLVTPKNFEYKGYFQLL